jgi:hypothetical protein
MGLQSEIKQKNELLQIFEERKQIVLDPDRYTVDAREKVVVAQRAADEAKATFQQEKGRESIAPSEIASLQRVAKQLAKEADWRQKLSYRIEHGQKLFDEDEIGSRSSLSKDEHVWPRSPGEITSVWLSFALKETVQ